MRPIPDRERLRCLNADVVSVLGGDSPPRIVFSRTQPGPGTSGTGRETRRNPDRAPKHARLETTEAALTTIQRAGEMSYTNACIIPRGV